ncbi:DUF4215 domain-containing protein [Archangium sp. Cb G35]|uniref:DUF4215 domain-containing protein n=1 Tax=Archangium sp. Cb G35 TaxID=1920190 RepID=UPI0009F865D2|nr:DUF4215 domain-containing protein [Archangium sp. Cb G35]
MRKEFLSYVRPGFISILAVTFLALPLQSCLQPTSVDCGPDFTCPAGMKCAAKQDKCIEDDCGDNIVQPGEVCDDGNIIDGDGCSSKCHSLELCGNGIADKGETCDDGKENGQKNKCNKECTAITGCGNTVKEDGEACDEGTKNTATCNRDCSPPRCGDGLINEAANEECEPSDADPFCNINCTHGFCGDGIVNLKKEECDSGKGISHGKSALTSTCNDDCTIPRCGDGIINKAAGEDCEPSDTDPFCNINCTYGFCGDGLVNPKKEECDGGKDGKAANTATCNINCTLARCGDGYVNKAADEECEPSVDSSCNANCKLTNCGDGAWDFWTEACDDGNTDDCGTCSRLCDSYQEVLRATGSIALLPHEGISDGNLLSITTTSSDGEAKTTVFEFDKTPPGTSSPSHIRIDINNLSDSGKIATKIANELNIQAPETNVSASKVKSNTVSLQHKFMGTIGNETSITTTSKGLYVMGLSDGVGVGCSAGIGCKYNMDCKSGVCDSGKCK